MKLTGYNSEAVLRNLIDLLRIKGKGNYNKAISYRNGHSILTANKGYNLYYIYKRQPFFHFNKVFKEFIQNNPELDGFGESINLEVLQRCKRYGCRFIILARNDKTYCIPVNLIKSFCEKNGLIRGQIRLNNYLIIDGCNENKSEVTYSFPEAILTPIEQMLF